MTLDGTGDSRAASLSPAPDRELRADFRRSVRAGWDRDRHARQNAGGWSLRLATRGSGRSVSAVAVDIRPASSHSGSSCGYARAPDDLDAPGRLWHCGERLLGRESDDTHRGPVWWSTSAAVGAHRVSLLEGADGPSCRRGRVEVAAR
jgi:hypothetical protein